MTKKSAGVLMYRIKNGEMEFLLVHPGGPFWANKDAGVWSIPKGEFTDEFPETAARREFAEETGTKVDGKLKALSPQLQNNGKLIYAFAIEGSLDETKIKSNMFEMEWPPKSGVRQSFPEVDRGGWFKTEEALVKINPGQAAFINEAKRSGDEPVSAEA